tara:strand:+ start:1675 stop:1917 length:243 start_codon:yes stop_codon:yes gene_type:complete
MIRQVYSDPKREAEKYALPNVEVFYYTDYNYHVENPEEALEPGYYFWDCFPGCLPDSEPWGPYETEQKAIEAAQEEASSG